MGRDTDTEYVDSQECVHVMSCARLRWDRRGEIPILMWSDRTQNAGNRRELKEWFVYLQINFYKHLI